MDSVRSSLNYMHVFLGRGHNNSQKIILCAPYHTNFSEITCNLFQGDTNVKSLTRSYNDAELRNFIFEFGELDDNTPYQYNFELDGKPLDLGGGLTAKDLHFTFWKELNPSSEVVLISCNGVDEFKNPQKKWDMWRKLYTTINSSSNKPKLLLLGGDQYYQDATEKEFINKLDGEVSAELHQLVKMSAINRIFEQTSDLSYRKLLCQIPSFAMLDDHDIADGAGGRYLTDGVFERKYINYSKILIELFEAFQASRNPPQLLVKSGSAYSFSADLGNSTIIALDLRTEKNSSKKILMQEDHKAAVLAALRNCPNKNVMLMIPVVPARSSREVEGALTGLAKLCKLEMVQNWFKKIHPKLGEMVAFIAESEDDLEDALTSEVGMPFFEELLLTMAEKAATGTQYTILTGDIHTGGSVEMSITANGYQFSLPIIVSSPIGYYPMPKIAEGLLKESTYINIRTDRVLIEAVPNQFYTNRNFVIICPHKLIEDKPNAARIYQENVHGYKRLNLTSWEQEVLLTDNHSTLVSSDRFTQPEVQN